MVSYMCCTMSTKTNRRGSHGTTAGVNFFWDSYVLRHTAGRSGRILRLESEAQESIRESLQGVAKAAEKAPETSHGSPLKNWGHDFDHS